MNTIVYAISKLLNYMYLCPYMSFFIVSSSSLNSVFLSLIELTAARHDCLSLYSSMSRGFSWCQRALNLSSSCWKACTLDSTLLFITSTCQKIISKLGTDNGPCILQTL